MIAAIKPAGSNTRGLLAYIYGPGRHDEHLDPHLVAGFAMLGMPDPSRDENATLTELARHLDAPVALRNSEFGQPVTEHVWHCPVRSAPEDRYLNRPGSNGDSISCKDSSHGTTLLLPA